MQRAEILKAALELPEEERERLVEDLEASFASPDIEEAWATEIERRIAEVDSGSVKTIPWTEVRDEIQERLGRPSWPLNADRTFTPPRARS